MVGKSEERKHIGRSSGKYENTNELALEELW
jgi:hypothetical protein